jgi:hypothetical protein
MKSVVRCYQSCPAAVALLSALLLAVRSSAEDAALSSWNDGPAKQSIVNFVKNITDKSSPRYVEHQDRTATFDQDGTLWVEHPMYGQVMFALDRVVALRRNIRNGEPAERFKSGRKVLSMKNQWKAHFRP